MKNKECDIVKDLMQNYIDKVSSEATNDLIETHIQTCKECNVILNQMQKDVDIEPLIEQNEQVDYLKGFKKKKIGTIIATIIITILVLFIAFLWITKFIEDTRVNINLDKLSIEGWYLEEEGKLGCYLWNNKNNIVYDIVEDKDNKEIYINVLGKYSFSPVVQQWRTENTLDINKIYVKNKEGNIRLIWDKSKGLLVENISNNIRESNKKQEEILRSLYKNQ